MKIHNLGFPRIGKKRELKHSLESFWKGRISKSDLKDSAKKIERSNWQLQSFLDYVPVGDFSLYDHVLDMSFILGNIPERVLYKNHSSLDKYFLIARGRSSEKENAEIINAGEMTKWFDTNYHYIVPEFSENTSFKVNPNQIVKSILEAKIADISAKPVIVGPATYLWLGKEKDNSNKYDLFPKLLSAYIELIDTIADTGVEWIQIDEPIFVTELNDLEIGILKKAYKELTNRNVKILLTSYFGKLKENIELFFSLPVEGYHVDAVRGINEINQYLQKLPKKKVLSLGLIDGRNIWKTDLNKTLNILKPINDLLGDRLWIAPSCSLLHVPIDLSSEDSIDEEIKLWLSFAVQKLEELKVLSSAINKGLNTVVTELNQNKTAINSRKISHLVNNQDVKIRVNSISCKQENRRSSYEIRSKIQKNILNLPKYPTTTIGSFPQTKEIRSLRHRFKIGDLCTTEYTQQMQESIRECIKVQEDLGLDVLVHGEPERNDMVEYFGEKLNGFIFTKFGWVQSYGSRCVKPPIIFGDISRPEPMTVDWITYAQSQTKKPVKGMLTGPVTILNWSFVRDDQPRSLTCLQLSLAVRDEVLDLEKAGIKVIQIDEAALREGLPLRQSEWSQYLDWAVKSFKIAGNGVKDKTQIHTHMCYSEFNDIIEEIASMDADVITIENSRSDMELLKVFDKFNYPNEIGPGVYDIHSPNIPSKENIVNLIKKALKSIQPDKLWINPDCGLKTRDWPETIIALKNMVAAAKLIRQ